MNKVSPEKQWDQQKTDSLHCEKKRFKDSVLWNCEVIYK
jgi:hypothetical protein